MPDLFEPLTLPNGQTIANRVCKAAMEENLADPGQIPGQRLFNLYQTWADGGAGLLLSGNVMIAPDAMTGPGGVVLQDNANLSAFQQWADHGRKDGAHFWMQINHPGRQVYAAMGETAYAPSEVALDLGNFSKLFSVPVALSHDQITTIIARFASTAGLAEQAGFSGVQIHAAHGYLISQFLSPLTNQRNDQWGGSKENRARLLFEVVRAVRRSVKAEFCVSVKLNSADFQQGGFDQEDARWVVEQLNHEQVDLIELSGGSYESPAMQGGSESTEGGSSTLRREAFFIEFAQHIAAVATMPIMVTGGILRRSIAEEALAKDAKGFGVEMLGIARGFAYQPELAKHWQEHELEVSLPQINWKNKVLAALAVMAVTKYQLNRMALGKPLKPNVSPVIALLLDRLKTKMRTRRYRRWRASS